MITLGVIVHSHWWTATRPVPSTSSTSDKPTLLVLLHWSLLKFKKTLWERERERERERVSRQYHIANLQIYKVCKRLCCNGQILHCFSVDYNVMPKSPKYFTPKKSSNNKFHSLSYKKSLVNAKYLFISWKWQRDWLKVLADYKTHSFRKFENIKKLPTYICIL